MNAKQAAEWKADRRRRVAEMKARLLATPEPTKAEKKRCAEFGALCVRIKAYRDKHGWGEGS